MAKARWCGEQIYSVAQTFRDDCLRHDGSLFTTGEAIWTIDNVRALEAPLADDSLSGSFIAQLEAQMNDLPPAVVQLGAELLYMLLLAELDTGGPKRREHISTILGMLDSPVTLAPELDAALDAGGVANFSNAKSFRDYNMRLLVRITRRVKECSSEERDELLTSPWRFRAIVEDERTSTDGMQANAILHLLFPDSFEYMVSKTHRQKLISTFAAASGVSDADNDDRKIQVIRELASQSAGSDLDLYEDPFQRIWKEPASQRWDEAVHWSRRLFERDDFDETERTYKLEIAARIARARDAVLAGGSEWPDLLRGAITNSRNNLTSWRAHDGFLRWVDEDSDDAREALLTIWRGDAGSREPPLRGFLEALPTTAVSGPGTRLSIASFLLMGTDATRFPFFKTSVDRGMRKMLGLTATRSLDLDPETLHRPGELAARLGLDGRRVRGFLRLAYPREEGERGDDWYLTAEQAEAVITEFQGDLDPSSGEATYAEWSTLLEELRLRMLASGTQLRDLLDAQGLAWWLARAPAPDDWTTEDQAAFAAFRKGSEPPADDDLDPAEPIEVIGLPDASPELATRLHLPRTWLQRLLSLLAEKKQLIMYGPPGTGKTFVAQHLAAHIEERGGTSRLVQFHPSYTYEDFFEGYRPQQHGSGALSFELVPGTLREIAKAAAAQPDRPHLLIIDEINRGNIAKIFGELYFLLEYRDQKIQLQYSRDELFQLPDNLYVIGTMNTADRSIALVDSALRRRFYFVGLIPTRAPVDQVLAKWLAVHDLDPEPAALLDGLNRSIADEEFSIGPSYFMTGDGSAPDLERVWHHAIMPLLEERYYGAGQDLDAEFGLSAIRKRLATEADELATDDDHDA